MSDPNDKQKCGTFVHDPDAPGCCIGCGDAPEAHTPRADGSAAEVKRYYAYSSALNGEYRAKQSLEVGMSAFVLATAYEAVVAERDRLLIRDQDATRHELRIYEQNRSIANLLSRVAELERALEHIKITIAAKPLPAVTASDRDIVAYIRALSKGSQP